jgi:hypothetical protein
MSLTVDQVLAEASGTLQGWLDGWTQPEAGSGEPQRRVRVIDAGDWYVDIKVEAARFSDEEDRQFRIALAVQELPDD